MSKLCKTTIHWWIWYLLANYCLLHEFPVPVWWSGKLEDWNLPLKPFIPSCWEVNTSWPMLSQLGQVPYPVLLCMWSYSSDEDILFQERGVKKTSPHSACLGISCPFQLSWGWFCLYPLREQKVVLKCYDHISFIMAFTWGKKKSTQISFSWKHTKPPELRDLGARVSAWRMLGAGSLC